MNAEAIAPLSPAEKNWIKLCPLNEIPPLGSRVVASQHGDIAIFRLANDEVLAVHDKCPHKGGPLSQGLVSDGVVTCPLHSWKIDLKNGEAISPDVGCTKTFAVKRVDDDVWIAL